MVLLIFLFAACSAEKIEQSADNQQESSYEDVSSDETNEGLINEDIIPDGFNRDLVPLVGGSEIRNSDEVEQDGNKAYVLVCYSKKEKEDILEFYKEVLENATDKEEGTFSTGSLYINGKLDNAKISILIGDEDVREEYKSFYNLTLEMIE